MLEDLDAAVDAEEGNVTDGVGVVLTFFAALSFLNFSFRSSQAIWPSPGLWMQYIPHCLFSKKCPSSHQYHFAPSRSTMQCSSVLCTFLRRHTSTPQVLRQIEHYVFLRISWYEKTRLIHVLCASSQLWGLHGGAVLRTTRAKHI
jgi:hypothetical protein